MTPRRALTRNAGDRQQVKRAGKTERQLRARDAGYLNEVLSTYEGRALLWRVVARCGPHKQTHMGEATHDTAFQNGERNIGLWLEAEIATLNLPAWQLMQTENAQREAQIPEAPATPDEQSEQSEQSEHTEELTDGN